MAKALVGLAMAVAMIGCESGEEVTGVESASATRQADGKVTIAVKTTCDLKWGMGRVDGNCDSDGDEICFHADWSEPKTHGKILFSKIICKDIDHAYSGSVTITSPSAIPSDQALDIHIYTENNACGSDEAAGDYVCGIYIPSPTK